MKYKVGDKVRRKSDGAVDIIKLLPGMPEYDSRGYLDALSGFVLYKEGWEAQEYWEPVEKTLDDLKIGDIVIDKDGYFSIFVAKWDEFYILRFFKTTVVEAKRGDDFNSYSEEEVKCYGIRPYIPEEKVELTLDEIAEKFGVNVNNLKIKK